MNKKDREKLYAETNTKFVQRVENMIYYVCGCDTKRAKEILEECLKRNKQRKNPKKIHLNTHIC